MSLPRVTGVLSALGFTNYYGSHEYAIARGRAVHKAIDLAERGELDWDALHPDLAGPLAAYREFKAQMGLKIVATEMDLTHPTWKYTGHPDALTDLGMLLDWKVSESPDLKTATLQLAAYKMLVEAQPEPVTVQGCYVVQLSPDGRYAIHDVTDPEAEQIWLACLVVYKALQTRGRIPA